MIENSENNLDEIRRIYPHMTDDQLRVARDNLKRYVAVVLLRIYDRLKAEGKNWPLPGNEA
jgi:hypothetical protein